MHAPSTYTVQSHAATHSVGDFRLVPVAHVVHDTPSVSAHPEAERHDPSMATFPVLHRIHPVVVQTAHPGYAVPHAVHAPSRSTNPSSHTATPPFPRTAAFGRDTHGLAALTALLCIIVRTALMAEISGVHIYAEV